MFLPWECPGLQPDCRIPWKQVRPHVLCVNFVTATTEKQWQFLKAAFKLYEMFDSVIWDSDGPHCHVIVK
jgi:hypothetical protein